MDPQASHPGRCPITSSSRRGSFLSADAFVKLPSRPISRRTLLRVSGLGLSAAVLSSVGSLAWMPKRVRAMTANTTLPDIQFDIANFLHPVQTIAGVPVQFGVVFTLMAPARLTRTPDRFDQQTLEQALETIEANYDFSPGGIITMISYGIPYFNRLPGSVVANNVPRLSTDISRFVLEEAVPGPTDFGQPNISKAQANFQVPVRIEHNDVLFTFRSDALANITDTLDWLNGSDSLNGNFVPSPDFDGLFSFQTPRFNFVQPGLPRQLADQLAANGVQPFATVNTEINPASSMWMGFVDQQVDGSAFLQSNPNINSGVPITFATNGQASDRTSSQYLTTALPGDYFDNGAIQHFSHDLDDLEQFYNTDPNKFTGAEPFSERVQYMFSSRKADGSHALPFPEDPNDPFTNGGGLGAPTGDLATQQQSAFLLDFTLGPNAIFQNFDPAVLPTQKLRVGHEFALQRSSRAPDGTPLHMRMDGPGLSSLDVPDGSELPTLEFTIFVPTSEFFRQLRINAASQDLVETGGSNGGTATSVPAGVEPSDDEDDGLERFISATRRQNFLIPPRRHRSFPLLEFT